MSELESFHESAVATTIETAPADFDVIIKQEVGSAYIHCQFSFI